MKFFTEGLMNVRPEFSIKIGRKLKYYSARSNHADITLMWMEEKYTRKMRTFPCLIREGSVVRTYKQKFDEDHLLNNEALMDRWNALIRPDNVHTDYAVEELSEKEFYQQYRAIKAGTVENF